MTQARLDHAVARATGESLKTVRRRGFSIADSADVDFDPEPYSAPGTVDWDELDARRVALLPNRSSQRRLTA